MVKIDHGQDRPWKTMELSIENANYHVIPWLELHVNFDHGLPLWRPWFTMKNNGIAHWKPWNQPPWSNYHVIPWLEFWPWFTMVKTMVDHGNDHCFSWNLIYYHDKTWFSVKNRDDHGWPWSSFRLVSLCSPFYILWRETIAGI